MIGFLLPIPSAERYRQAKIVVLTRTCPQNAVIVSHRDPYIQSFMMFSPNFSARRGIIKGRCGEQVQLGEIGRQQSPQPSPGMWLPDLFLWDIKDTDPNRHQQYTGVSNERILENLRLADSMGAKTRIRCILVNGVNTEMPHYEKIAEIYHMLRHCEGVEFLPYHSFGGTKSAALGKANSGNNPWIPTKEQVSKAKNYLLQKGVPIFRG